MFPRRDGWIPKFKKSAYSESQPKRSSFRSVRPSNRSFSANEDHYYRKRQKPHVLAGMFANAKSSVPVRNPSLTQSSLSKHVHEHPNLTEAYSESSRKVSKFYNFPRADVTQSWDFSDVSSTSDKSARIPSPKRLNSDEEHNKTEEISIPITNIGNPVVPWLRRTCSDDESSTFLKPKKYETVEYPDCFEETIDSFFSRLDQIGALPSIPLQNHTDTTMGKVEKALIAVALGQTKDRDCQKSLPVYDILVERSDWLIFQEEFNDDNDYLPKDPFYTHDVVSSDFEEYLQEKEATNAVSYSKMLSSASQKEVEDDKLESPKDPFCPIKESQDLDSQEDFFNLNFPSTSQKIPQVHERRQDSFPIFDEFCSTSTSTNRKRNVSSELFTPVPSTSTKRQIPIVRQLSSEYSPFNFDFLESSSPPSPKTSHSPSKYSIW